MGISDAVVRHSFVLVASIQYFDSITSLVFSGLCAFVFMLRFVLLRFLFRFGERVSVLRDCVLADFVFVGLLVDYFLLFTHCLFCGLVTLCSMWVGVSTVAGVTLLSFNCFVSRFEGGTFVLGGCGLVSGCVSC